MGEFPRVSMDRIGTDTDNTSANISPPRPENSHHSVRETPLAARNLWTPSCLQPVALIVLMVLMTLMIAALEIIYQVAQRNQGLASTSLNEHYLWTYGPTAVFTAIASYWDRIAYHTAFLMPWKSIQRGPLSAKHSILVDYRYSWMPSMLWFSARNRHFAVLLAVLGTLVLLLETILSTGLFTLQSIDFTRPTAFVFATERYLGPNMPYGSDNVVESTEQRF